MFLLIISLTIPTAVFSSVDYSDFLEYEVKCDIKQRHRLSLEQGCSVLKDYKLSSKIFCPDTILHSKINSGNCSIAEVRPWLANSSEEKVKRRVRREESFPKIQDSRNFLEPTEYHRYEAIKTYLEDLASRHASFVRLETVTTTTESRSIMAIRIGFSRIGQETPTVLIDGGMHAREWVTVGTAIQLIGRLVSMFLNPSKSCDEVLTSVDWYIVPLLNPDGYEFSFTSDRLWRKNRRPPPPGDHQLCFGVDINRNFPLGYGKGASENTCSEVYKGTEAGSEAETRAIIFLSERLNSTMLYYISLHAYGQSWLTPWGYTTNRLENYQDLEDMAKKVFKQMECSYGKAVPSREWEVGGAAEIYYIAGGASDDWVLHNTETSYAYTVELPDDGREFGFFLPAERVPEVAADIWIALRSLTLNILALD